MIYRCIGFSTFSTTELYIKFQSRVQIKSLNGNIASLKTEIEYKKMFSKKYTRQQTILEFDKNVQDRYRIGCVYYIQEKDTKNIKIGWCWKLQKRLKSLQVSNSQKLSIVKYELTQFPYKREQELHDIYKNNHIRGEWFENIFKDNC